MHSFYGWCGTIWAMPSKSWKILIFGLDDDRKPEQDIGMNVVENFIAVEEIKYPLEGDSISLIKEEGIPFGGENLLPCENAFSVGDETLMASGGEFPLPGERPPISLMEEHACISNMKEEDNLKGKLNFTFIFFSC